MADGALAPVGRQAARKPRVSKRLQQAIELLASNECKTQKEAADRVGLTPEHLCKSLAKPHVRAILREHAEQTYARSLPRSAKVIAELLNNPSGKVALEAAKFISAIGGIQPLRSGTNINVGVQVSAGYVIKLDGSKSGPPTIDATAIIDSDAT